MAHGNIKDRERHMKYEDYIDPPSGPLLSVDELASYFNISPNTLRGWCNDEEVAIPHLRLGSGRKAAIRFMPDEIDRWVESRRRPGGTKAP